MIHVNIQVNINATQPHMDEFIIKGPTVMKHRLAHSVWEGAWIGDKRLA